MLKAGKADLPDLARLLTDAGQQGKPRRSNLCKRDKLENLDFFPNSNFTYILFNQILYKLFFVSGYLCALPNSLILLQLISRCSSLFPVS